MAGFTVEDLTRLLRECAGEDEDVDLDGDIVNVTFEELGYDSLALFNTVSRIERDHGVTLDDDIVTNAKTPGDLLRVVGTALGRSA
ncbi:actinorhodin polyketide synthase [Spongiactinospora rosea]|uniref:Actinorhodin polyketide synthase n=1 Tax=Spongiactinospora rosea TaxID=2248750 RepID=A0A366M1J9_9ACTN|nr:acyl carrier protein [Spongiactinospora rosea]RBQ20088.1 actinorhodin polyketide synthase [Spongiactinospora rosea]